MKPEQIEKPNTPVEPVPGFEAEKVEKGPVVESGQTEILLPETLEFMRNHIDLTEFDPSWELREIRAFVKTLPPESQSSQRKKLIREFKAKLGIMRENMANTQIEMEQLFRDNPDTTEEEAETRVSKLLIKNVVSLGEEYRQAVRRYLEIRYEIKGVITRYKTSHESLWEAELFKDLFDRYPRGKVEIEITLAGIYIRIHDIEDFVTAYSESKNDESAQKNARMSGGAQLHRDFTNIPQLSQRVTIENTSTEHSGVKTHEEEHAIHWNLYPQELFGTPRHTYYWQFETRRVGYDDFAKEAFNFIEHNISIIKGLAKTEILAYLKDGRFNIGDIRALLTEKNGLYDYLQFYENEIENTVVRRGLLERMSIKVEREGVVLNEDETVKIAIDLLRKAYEKDYLRTLELALDAVLSLLNRYGREPQNKAKVINLLSQEPLNKWPRLAKILS